MSYEKSANKILCNKFNSQNIVTTQNAENHQCHRSMSEQNTQCHLLCTQ